MWPAAILETMTGPTLAGYVELLIGSLRDSAVERGRELPAWDRVLITEDEGATGEVDDAVWTPLAESEERLQAARTRTTRDWVNVVAHHVADGALYVVIEFLTDEHGASHLPPDSVSVNLSGPTFRWLDSLPPRR